MNNKSHGYWNNCVCPFQHQHPRLCLPSSVVFSNVPCLPRRARVLLGDNGSWSLNVCLNFRLLMNSVRHIRNKSPSVFVGDTWVGAVLCYIDLDFVLGLANRHSHLEKIISLVIVLKESLIFVL